MTHCIMLFNFFSIFSQMIVKDKDYRYMATSDLLNELNKETFKPDNDLEIKLTNVIIQQLGDAASDVSGLAVKWYSISLVTFQLIFLCVHRIFDKVLSFLLWYP